MKIFKNKKGIGFVSSGIKILISVVIGSLLLGGVFVVTKNNVLPSTEQKIATLFDYSENKGTNNQERVTGDINSDGTVEEADLNILRSELISVSGNYDTAVLDINGDGNFDILDLVRLKKVIAQASQ